MGRSASSNGDEQLESAVEAYNLYCRREYRRPQWRDLRIDEFIRHASLANTLLGWTERNGWAPETTRAIRRVVHDRHEQLPRQDRRIPSITAPDPSALARILTNGDLAIVPNSQIYVFFGADDRKSTASRAKINQAKLRHPEQQLVELALNESVIADYVHCNRVRGFLEELVDRMRPIGLLFDAEIDTTLFVFYPGQLFKDLQGALQSEAGADLRVWVSSANLTTCGANTTAGGVQRDFGACADVAAMLDQGDLREDSSANNSTTIVRVRDSGSLEYYRLGYPGPREIDRFAAERGLHIKLAHGTRTTTAQ